MARGTKAGSAFIELILESQDFRSELRTTTKDLRNLGRINIAINAFHSLTTQTDGLIASLKSLGSANADATGAIKALVDIMVIGATVAQTKYGPALLTAVVAAKALAMAIRHTADEQAKLLAESARVEIEGMKWIVRARAEADDKEFERRTKAKKKAEQDAEESKRREKRQRDELKRTKEEIEEDRKRALESVMTPEEQHVARINELRDLQKRMRFFRIPNARDIDLIIEREQKKEQERLREKHQKEIDKSLEEFLEHAEQFVPVGPKAQIPSLGAVFGGRLAEQIVGPQQEERKQTEVQKKQLNELQQINKRLREGVVVP